APLNAVKARNKTIFPLVLYLPSIEPPSIKLDAASHRRPVSPEVPSTAAGFSSVVIPSPRIGPRCHTNSIRRISELDLFAVDSSAQIHGPIGKKRGGDNIAAVKCPSLSGIKRTPEADH